LALLGFKTGPSQLARPGLLALGPHPAPRRRAVSQALRGRGPQKYFDFLLKKLGTQARGSNSFFQALLLFIFFLSDKKHINNIIS
jgi:hypothetical protein